MQTKLTLRLEESLIEAAKEEATRRGTSLSRLVADLFRSLVAANGQVPESPADSETTGEAFRRLSPRTRRLLGVLRDAEVDVGTYRDHLERKHRP